MNEWLPEMVNSADHAGVTFRRGERFGRCTCGKRFWARTSSRRWHKHLQRVAVVGYRNVVTDELLVPDDPATGGIRRFPASV